MSRIVVYRTKRDAVSNKMERRHGSQMSRAYRVQYQTSKQRGNIVISFFYCCTVHFNNIKILFTNKCTLLLNT